MKEKAKSFAKVRLKCFRDNSDGTNNKISVSSGKEVHVKNTDENLYKNLLNEVPCTSNEKGTMTDAALKKKDSASISETQSISTSPLSYPNIHNVLQSVSKNKADSKVPIVLLSKSPEKKCEKSKSKAFSAESKKINIFEFIASEFENSGESDGEPSKVPTDKNNITSSITYSPEKNDTNSSLSGFNESIASEQISPDFKGFSSAKIINTNNIEGKLKCNNEKICRKKLFGNVGKETSIEKVVTTLDHSYSHDTPEKSKLAHPPSDSSLSNTEFPRFVNRSVFGSPTLSKNPPDIMLHNDKINILRQMSQVFNDEKKLSNSINCQNKTKINAVNVKLKTSPSLATKTSALSISTTTASITTTTATSQMIVAKESYSKSSSCPSALPSNSIFEKVSVKSNSNTEIVLLEKDKGKEKIEIIKEKISPVRISCSSKSPTSSLQDDSGETNLFKPNDPSKCEDKNTETATVHLVSSYAFDREESIKVQSYSGSKGEDIDIIDGFTFFSFTTESEMMSYSPSKSRKLKKKKVLIKSQNKSKHLPLVVKNKDEINNSEKVAVSSLDGKESEILDNSSENNKTLAKEDNLERLENQETKAESNETCKDKIEKVSESSAFSSNDLDQYLTEHAELKISFPIPKCSATEKGVTKFDVTGNPIQQYQESLPETNCRNDKLPSANSSINESNLVQTSEAKTTILKQYSTDLDFNNKVEGNLKIDCKPSSLPPKLCKVSGLKGNDLVVKRGGTLLPLSKVFKKNGSNNLKEKESKSEIIYVPHRGQMLTLCGSLTKVNPSNSGSIKAKVALPRGHRRLFKHAFRVASRKVKAVEINEDLAEFALSALKTPTKDDKSTSIDSSQSGDKKKLKFVKPSKENILDILTAKFSIGKDLKLKNSPDSKNSSKSSVCSEPNSQALSNDIHKSENGKKSDFPSKIKWTQDDILKKKDLSHTTEESKGFKKNINRFPSLSREMKRLNMNFVTYNKESEEETDSASEIEMKDSCTEEFCKMGCICDSLRCRQKPREHCGKVECMFECVCSIESWKDGKTTKAPLCVVSILNADREKLALKEKDFKRTIVQSGSDLFLLGSEKKKRDIRIPQRFRDTNIWKTPSPTFSYGDSFEGDRSNKENVPILPNVYKEYIKDFKLSIPWYDVNGVSIWCMFHSCYDCTCLSDGSFYCEAEDQSSLSSDCEDVVIDKTYQNIPNNNFLPLSLTENKIVCLNFKFNNSVNIQSESNFKGHWTLKHWIHNAHIHSSRTSGYDIREKIVKDMHHDLKEGYTLPLPKAPFVMGITLKNRNVNDGSKKNVNLNNNVSPYSKAVFYDGLGPGVSFIPSAAQGCELFAKFSGNRQLCGIYLKNFEEPPSNISNVQYPKNTPLSCSIVKTVAENSMTNSTYCEGTSKKENLPTNDCSTSSTSPPITSSTSSTTTASITGSILQTEYLGALEKDDPKNDKCFSLYEMIKEEEKRGELELDLSPKNEGKAILITESRFRKLINMNIIGIIGLNKAGRCIINTVKSSEDLIKMQRLQQLISNNTIDVGPNMREIFASSAQVDHRIRYVMIRCDVGGRWEIVGIVQRKNKENLNVTTPKPKRHKIKSPMPALLLNQAKCRSQSPTTSELSDNVENPLDSLDERNDEGKIFRQSHSNLENISNTQKDIREEISVSKDSVPDNLIIEEGEIDSSLPCISSVVSGSDPSIGKLIGSPPKATSSENSVFHKTKAFNLSGIGNYILNQPSSKIFGYDAASATSLSSCTFPSKNIITGNLRLDSSSTLRPKVGNFVLCPRIVSSTPSVISSNIGTGSSFSKVVATSVPNDKMMLLLSSTTPSGKSFLIPTMNNTPVSYSMIVRGQTSSSYTTSGKMTPAVLSCNSSLNSNQKAENTFYSNVRPTKLVPQVQASKVSVIPIADKSITTNISKSLAPMLPVQKQNLSNVSVSGNNSPVSGKISFHTSLTSSTNCSTLNTSLSIPSTVVSSIQQSISEKVDIHHPDSSYLSTSPNVSSQPPVSNCKVGALRSSPSSQVKFLDSTFDAKDITEKGCKGQIASPDVKCISVKRFENCSAVDLSIKFKSIKLHWLSGTIRKSVLLSIFKMSRKINAPVSLSAKNDTAHQSSFLGMFKFCKDDNGRVFPVLVLGNGLKSVLATSELCFRELFRSNTLKYLINDDSGEISSYTYDAKGVNLIRIASKRKESGVQIHKLGEKIPVETLREALSGIDFVPNIRRSASLPSNNENEEIILSDSDDEGSSSKTYDDKSQKLSMEISSGNCSEQFAKSASSTSLNAPVSKNNRYSFMTSNLKRKLENNKNFPKASRTFSQQDSQNTYEPSKKLKSNLVFSSVTDTSKDEPLEKQLKIKPVLKIPNPYLKSKPDVKNLKPIDTENCKSKVEKPSTVEQIVKYSLDNSDQVATSLACNLNVTPTKVKQTLKLSPNKKPSLSFDSSSSNKLSLQHNTENVNSNIDYDKNSSQNTNIKNASNLETKTHQNSDAITSSKNNGNVPDNEELSLETKFTSNDVTSNLSTSKELEVEILSLPLKNNVTEPVKQHVVKRKIDNKPCPLSRKLFRRKEVNQHCQNQTESSFTKSFTNFKSKFFSPPTPPTPTKSSPSTPPKTSLNGNRSLSSSTSNQEFQQVFSGAPQFWLMDNTEKHNTLERIRRKGLARMLENLYMKSVNISSGAVRLPPKHIVLKKAENVILELRAKELELAKTEINLREEKTLLLNNLSDILKDCQEDVQKDLEQWISSNISNPTAKNKFEETWKPQNVIFEDEHIYSSTCGQLTVSGADITSYFATHTAGFTPAKSPPKYKAVKSQLSRRKFKFNLSPPKSHHQSQQNFSSLKNKLTHILKTRSPPFHASTTTTNSLCLENPSDRARFSDIKSPHREKDHESRWFDIVTPPRRSSVTFVAETSDEDDDSNSREKDKSLLDTGNKDDAETEFGSSGSSSPESESLEDKDQYSPPVLDDS